MARKESFDDQYKILLIGDSTVGKSSLLLRFSQDAFTESTLLTIGVDFDYQIVKIDGFRVRLQLWDTAGQERFRTITKSYYRGADGVLLVYDITDRKSFEHIRTLWLPEIQLHGANNLPILLVGNKCDLDSVDRPRKVSEDEGKATAADLGIEFIETSAKSSENVKAAFMKLAYKIAKRQNSGWAMINKEDHSQLLQTMPVSSTVHLEKIDSKHKCKKC